MSEKRFQKTRIVDKWGGIYDSETDKVLGVNDVEHKLNEQQTTINELKAEMVRLHKMSIELMDRVIPNLRRENEQLRNIIKQKEEEEKLYAKEILRLNELNKQTSEFTDVLGGY